MSDSPHLPEACDLLIEAGYVVPIEPHAVVLEDHAVAVRGSEIVAILPRAEARARFRATQVVSRPEAALMPGLVNAHTHNPMTLLRGVADDLPLMTWLQQHIWPVEAAVIGPEFVADGTTLAIAEMLRGGTTCANENYFFGDVQAAVYKKHGFRALVGAVIIDFPTAWAKTDDEYFAKAGELHDQWRTDPLIGTAFAPHAPYTVNDANFERVRMLSDQLDMQVHLHTHETAQEINDSIKLHGQRPLARLDRLGLVNDRLIAVHMTQLTDAEIHLCAERGVSVVHCPESNLKLASGFCPACALQRAGVNLAIGTDGCASNNDLDMFSENRTAAILAKAVADDATALDARWASASASVRSKSASRPTWSASTCPHWKPSRCTTCCRNWCTPPAASRSATSGSPASRSWCSASWSAWTCRASSPTRASGASASVISAPEPRRRKDSLMTAPHASSNFDQAELDKFAALANRWWDADGPQKPLHALNPVRLKYVADRVPLRGARVLDIGCGGGLLSEALAQAGADVTAIDLAPELVKVARLHALESGAKVDYRVQAAEDLAAEQPGSFDVVTCMEMLEHVPDPGAIIEACKRLLKPGGHLFLSTINRTAAAFAVAIVGAEYVARLLPKGTHHYQEFIKPAELARWLREADMQLVDVSGMAYEPWRNHARLSSRTDINYLAYAVKPA